MGPSPFFVLVFTSGRDEEFASSLRFFEGPRAPNDTLDCSGAEGFVPSLEEEGGGEDDDLSSGAGSGGRPFAVCSYHTNKGESMRYTTEGENTSSEPSHEKEGVRSD